MPAFPLWPHYTAFIDSNGDPVSGGTVEFYVVGTSTPLTVYAEEGLSTSLGTSVTTDAGGYAASGGSPVSIWASTDAKVIVKDSGGSTVRTIASIVGDTLEGAVSAGADIAFTGNNTHAGTETFTGGIEADDSDIDVTITDTTITTEGAHIGIHNQKTFVYRVEGIDENATKQAFKLTVADVSNVSGMLEVRAILDGGIPNGVSFARYPLRQVSDGAGPVTDDMAIDSFGNLALCSPVVSGNDIIFGVNIGNNGTSPSSNNVTFYITLISDDPDNFTFAGLDGATNHTGDFAASAFAFGRNLFPLSDDTYDLGDGTHRLDDIYATNATIQTSGAEFKKDILDPAATAITAVNAIPIKSFKLKNGSRTHIGVIAEDVEEQFRAAGIDAGDYGIFVESNGVKGLRMVELLALKIASLEAEVAALKAP